MTYVVHGATGAQGSPVVAALAAAGRSVTALARRPESLPEGVRSLSIDAGSAEQLTAAYRDAAGVFLHFPVTGPELRAAHVAAVAAALRDARPARVVYSTSGGPAEDEVVKALDEAGVPYAVVAPRYYFENLLMPLVQDGIRREGVLRYPLKDGYAASWSSHLDIADVALALFDRTAIGGTVEVGQYPAITGDDLAAAFAAAYGRAVAFQAQSPADMGAQLAPVMGEDAAAVVQGGYEYAATLPHNEIDESRSAQRLLGLTPRTAVQWLSDLGLAKV
ncbi:NmrA family NAD(P)-binding protein [Glycomyces sp. NPDC021274]|uniref:SDR family oxidoreductase n=1 Tax=Glycomyces sp. NPDC021274 TaxID=3155120 RepID=UPI0033DCDC37